MANPLSILLGGGGSQGHQQREAQIMEATAQATKPQAPPPAAQPTAAPANAVGQPTFLSSAATARPAPFQQAQKTLLGQ